MIDQFNFPDVEYHDIPWWVEQFKKPFSLARFGDGEFLCVQGKGNRNSHGCFYTPQLRADLEATLEDDRPGFYKGMQRILGSQYAEIQPLLKGKWIDTEIFADELVKGGLQPIFRLLRDVKPVIVSSANKRSVPIPYRHFIETPFTNAHAFKDELIREILEYGEPCIYLFACGMAATAFVHELHGKIPGASFIDIGHIFDPFIGDISREYLSHVDPEKLKENLL